MNIYNSQEVLNAIKEAENNVNYTMLIEKCIIAISKEKLNLNRQYTMSVDLEKLNINKKHLKLTILQIYLQVRLISFNYKLSSETANEITLSVISGIIQESRQNLSYIGVDCQQDLDMILSQNVVKSEKEEYNENLYQNIWSEIITSIEV